MATTVMHSASVLVYYKAVEATAICSGGQLQGGGNRCGCEAGYISMDVFGTSSAYTGKERFTCIVKVIL
jgi:hypothetical protein